MGQPFRFIHTSDWHLGQSFMGKSREREHRALLDWLVQIITQEQIDAVIIAGDVFDTSTPASYARALYNEMAEALLEINCQLIIIGGNHDSAAVLAENQSLLKHFNVHVVPAVAKNPKELVIPLRNAKNEVGALVCAIPFIRPRDLVRINEDANHQNVQAELMKQIRLYYQAVYHEAQKLNLAVPIIGTGHLTTFGAEVSESVRDIYVGTLKHFPVDAFPPFDYLALGHIHRSQAVGGVEHFRYSGSPIALSFDELGRDKEILAVTFDEDKKAEVLPIKVPVFQPMALVKGTLDSIEDQLEALSLSEKNLWVEIQVEQQGYLSDLNQRIDAMLVGKPIEVLRIRRLPTHETSGAKRQQNETLEELKHEEVFTRRLAEAELTPTEKVELTALYQQVVQHMEEQA